MKPGPEIRILKCDTCPNETSWESEYGILKMDDFTAECNHFIDEVEQQSWIEHYICYYLGTLLVNVILLALYVVQVISDHQPCLTKENYNITQEFEQAFLAGLFVLIADVVNTNLVEIYFRFQVQLEEQKFGSVLASSQRLAQTSIAIGWFLKGATLVVSAMQFLIIMSQRGQYCSKTFGVLSVESEWLYWMIGIQTSKVVIFAVWWTKLEKSEAEKRDSIQTSQQNSVPDLAQERMDQFTFDQKFNDIEKQETSGPLTQRFEMIIDNMRDEEHQYLMTKESKSSKGDKSSRMLSPYEAHQNIRRMKTLEKKEKAIQRQASEILSSTKHTLNPNIRISTLGSDCQSPMRVSAITRVLEEPEYSFYNEQIDFLTPPSSGNSKKSKFASTNGRMQKNGNIDFPSEMRKVVKTKKKKKSTSLIRKDSQL